MQVLQNSSKTKLLSGRLRRGLFTIALVEAIYAAGGVNELLFTGKERMASRADFYVQLAFFRRASLKCFSARTGNANFGVFRMDSRFHYFFSRLYRRRPGRKFKRVMIGVSV